MYENEEFKQKMADHCRAVGQKYKGKTWKKIDGKRVWMDK
jgi:hypothetical protein